MFKKSILLTIITGMLITVGLEARKGCNCGGKGDKKIKSSSIKNKI